MVGIIWSSVNGGCYGNDPPIYCGMFCGAKLATPAIGYVHAWIPRSDQSLCTFGLVRKTNDTNDFNSGWDDDPKIRQFFVFFFGFTKWIKVVSWMISDLLDFFVLHVQAAWRINQNCFVGGSIWKTGMCWDVLGMLSPKMCRFISNYPLVNVYITMENHHF